MTAPKAATTAPHPGLEWVPVESCTLPSAEQPLRVAEFDELFAASLRDAQPSADGARFARLLLGGDDTLPARV